MQLELKKFSDEISKFSERKRSRISLQELDLLALTITSYISFVEDSADINEAKNIFSASRFGHLKSNILHVIAKFGDEIQLEEILKFVVGDFSINIRDVNYFTPLHYAAQEGWLNSVKILVESGADNNPRSSVETRQWTPAHFAAKYGHLEVVKFLLNSGVDPKTKTSFGLNLLHISAEYGHADLVEFSLTLGLNKDDKTINENLEMTALHYAAVGGYFDATRILLEAGVNKNVRMTDGTTPLKLAASSGHSEIVSLLLNFGVSDLERAFKAAVENDCQPKTASLFLNWGVNNLEEVLEIAKKKSSSGLSREIEVNLKIRKELFKKPEKFSSALIEVVKSFNKNNLSETRISLSAGVALNAYGILNLRQNVGFFFKEPKTLSQLCQERKIFGLSSALKVLSEIVSKNRSP